MSFQPIIVGQGYGAWRFLQRTLDTQKEVLESSPRMARDLKRFAEKASSFQTADDLMNDRDSLRVALTAFGLEKDLNSRYFIKKILTEDTSERGSLVNKLSDKRYMAMAKAFGFGQSWGPNTALNSFRDDVMTRFKNKSFEIAVGNANPDVRVALNVKRGLEDTLKDGGSETAHWFKVMGNPPLRRVFEKALGLPSSIGKLDIDQQRTQFASRAKSVFGTDKVSDFQEPERQEKLIRMFLMRAQLADFSARNSSSQRALTLLSSIQFPKVGIY